MVDFVETLNQAVDKKTKSPAPADTLSALTQAEKDSRQQKPQFKFEQFFGQWRLHFINGTNKSRSQFASLLKDGFYLPPLIGVKISYAPLDDNQEQNLHNNQGRVINTVSVGLVKFTIEGPCKFIPNKNILAFDFTYLSMFILGKKIFSKDIRGGKSSDEQFFQESVSKQAFFSYFQVNDRLIAARGRSGGLALWRKE